MISLGNFVHYLEEKYQKLDVFFPNKRKPFSIFCLHLMRFIQLIYLN
jgi:hypothetical protein